MLLVRQVALPKVPCFALWSCFPMVLCAIPGGSCFPMVSEQLHWSGKLFHVADASASAKRQPLPHRLPLRSIPPAALRLRAPPIHEDMVVHGLCGRVPDSAGNACSLNCRCSDIANLSVHLHRLPTPPPYLRQMRLSPDRGAGVECWIRLQLGGCVVRANHRAHLQNINI